MPSPIARHLFGALCMSALATVPAHATEAPPSQTPKLFSGFLEGYLPREVLPNSLHLLPAPPTEGSIAFALDQKIASDSQKLRGGQRWKLAMEDANLKFPEAAGTFSCALNAPVSEAHTPRIYTLLRRTLTDAGLATYAAKNHYTRTRPFVHNQAPSCTPDDEAKLAKDGSYPSGHSAIGWAWALMLSELAPERSDALLARGRAYSESRVFCNVHWYSDIREGREIGAATLARLHSDPVFTADLAAARQELEAAWAGKLPPARDCAAETRALEATL